MASKDDQKCTEMCYASQNSAPTGILRISVAEHEEHQLDHALHLGDVQVLSGGVRIQQGENLGHESGALVSSGAKLK